MQRLSAHAQDLARLIKGQFPLHHLIAPVVVVEQPLRACLDPLDGPAAAARRPEHQALLRIGVALHAEAAADVLGDHPELRLGNVEHGLG